MKKSMIVILAAAMAAGAVVSASADARGRGGGGGHFSHSGWRGGYGGFHSRARVGVFIGAPLLAAPWYAYPSPYYYPYPYYPYPAVSEGPVTYIEQNPPVEAAPAPQAQVQQYWYYCQDSQTYYPHVQTCASPWQRVVPQTR